MIKNWYTLAVCSSLICLVGCGGSVSVPEDWPPWSQQLPARSLEAKVGEEVWAAVPRAGDVGALIGRFRVEAISGKTATLADSLGNRFEGIPGALIHSLPQAAPAAGDWVLVNVAAAGPVWGKLTDAETVSYDWNGVTVAAGVDRAVPLSANGSGLRRLSYSSHERQHVGLGIAENAESVWVLEADGHVRVLPKADVSAAKASDTDWQPGQKVRAHSWAMGLATAEIVAVVEPGLRYQVNTDEAGLQTVPFSSLLPAAD